MYSSSPPPGWYDNPVGDGQRRWDGQQWTGQVRVPWPEPDGPPPGPADRTVLQPTVAPVSADAYPPTVAMPVQMPMPMERLQRNAPSRGLSGRAWLAVGGVVVLALLGAAAAAVNRSAGGTDAGSADGSSVAVAPLAAAPGTEQTAPRSPAIESTTAVPAAALTTASSAAPSTSTTATTAPPTTRAPTTAPPTTRAPTTAPPTTPAPTTAAPTTQAPTTQAPTTQAPTTQAPTTQAPTTTAVEATVANAVTPGAFCSPEGATGLSAKGVSMICSSTNADGVPYGEGKSRWRSR